MVLLVRSLGFRFCFPFLHFSGTVWWLPFYAIGRSFHTPLWQIFHTYIYCIYIFHSAYKFHYVHVVYTQNEWRWLYAQTFNQKRFVFCMCVLANGRQKEKSNQKYCSHMRFFSSSLLKKRIYKSIFDTKSTKYCQSLEVSSRSFNRLCTFESMFGIFDDKNWVPLSARAHIYRFCRRRRCWNFSFLK